MDDMVEEPVRYRQWIGLFGSSAAVIGLIALTGLIFGIPFLASLGPDKIPMAPSTALFFFFYGMAIFFRTNFPLNRNIRRMNLAVNTAGAVAALLLLLSYHRVYLLTSGIVAAGYFFYRNHEKHYRAGVESKLSAIADLKVREFVQWRKERLGDAAVYYKNDNFSGLVRRHFEALQDDDAKRRLKTWLNKVRTAYQYDRVLLLDVHGTVRMSDPESPEPVARHFVREVIQVLNSGKVAFLDFYRDAPDHPVFLTVFVPLLEEQEGSFPSFYGHYGTEIGPPAGKASKRRHQSY